MIRYVKVEGLVEKQPVAVRTSFETGRPEYCFGCSLWKQSIRRAWADYQRSQVPENGPVAPCVPSSLDG
jgi:hypothetical protein